MIRMGLIASSMLLISFCYAQFSANSILDKNYYMICSNRWLNEISLSRDSIIECWKKENSIIRRWHFEIIEKARSGHYHVLYCRFHPVTAYPQLLKFCAFIYCYSKDNSRLYYSYAREFQTLEQVKYYCDTVHFNHEYFEIAYKGKLLNRLIIQPDIMQADSAAVQSVMNKLKAKLDSGMSKMKNSSERSVLYGSMFGQNMVSSSLISLHYNPLVSISDLNEKAVAMHVTVPKIDKRFLPSKFVLKRDTAHHKSINQSTAPKIDIH